MSRAAFLPFTGDPFLFTEWLRLFNDVWGGEIDHLYINLNATIPMDIISYCVGLIDNETPITMLQSTSLSDHGLALDKLLDVCQEDLIMLIEDDAFIFQKGQVDKCFKMIESGEHDLLGSARGSTADEVWKAENVLWDSPPQAPNFWPNFLFVKKSDLLKTDRNFSAKAWYKDELIAPINHIVKDQVVYGDTFVWASIQLRALGLRVKLIDQYHSSIDDIVNESRIEGIFDRKCPWIHIGSLSGWYNMLFNDLSPRIGEIEEWERRVAAWLYFIEEAEAMGIPERMRDFAQAYREGITTLTKYYNLSPVRITKRASIYRYLLNPASFVAREAKANVL